MKYFFGAEYTGKEKVDMIKQAQTEGDSPIEGERRLFTITRGCVLDVAVRQAQQ